MGPTRYSTSSYHNDCNTSRSFRSRPTPSRTLRYCFQRLPGRPVLGLASSTFTETRARTRCTTSRWGSRNRGSETNRQQTMSSSINNSTRMELSNAIIATYAPRPITIAIGSQDVVEPFKRTKDRRDKPTRWINKPDGDLWQFWESNRGECGNRKREMDPRTSDAAG